MKLFKCLAVFSFFFLFVGITNVIACNVVVEVQGEKKEIYKAGDEIILKVTLSYTHYVCPLQLSDTKFSTDGMKVTKATDWKEVSPGVYEKKIKLKVTGNKEGVLKFRTYRLCQKAGCDHVFTLNAAPIKK